MPYYRITVTLKSRQVHSGIRQLEVWNPDTALRMVEKTAHDHYGEGKVRRVDVVMLPKSSEEVKRFIAARGKK